MNISRSPFTGDLDDSDNFQFRVNSGNNLELETYNSNASTGVFWASNGSKSYTVEMSISVSILGIVNPAIGNTFSFHAGLNDDGEGVDMDRETQFF